MDTTLYINLSAIESNYLLIRDTVAPSECAAVVKANAYGLGVKEVSEKLYFIGCKKFFVANMVEGIELREILPDVDIFIFHGVSNGQEELLFKYNLIPVLNDLYQVKVWNDFAATHKTLPVIIHIDTGMNRLGLSMKDAFSLTIMDTENLNIRYIMSHPACMGIPDHHKNAEQLKKFNLVRKSFPTIPSTFSNSAASLLNKIYHFDMVRVGISIYGCQMADSESSPTPLQNVVKLVTKIIQIREIDTPQTVGYGATKKILAGSKLATVPIGYADGFFRSLGNIAYGYIGDTKVHVVGRISMDLTVFDVTDVPCNVGTEIELLGDRCTVDNLAELAGTIGYEILTNLGSRYKRIYL